jgi:hypothetical protein
MPHGLVEVVAHVLHVGLSRPHLGSPGLGDRVRRLATLVGALDEALLLELGEPGIDRSSARGIQPVEPVLKVLDDLVPVPRSLVEERQQVERS